MVTVLRVIALLSLFSACVDAPDPSQAPRADLERVRDQLHRLDHERLDILGQLLETIDGQRYLECEMGKARDEVLFAAFERQRAQLRADHERLMGDLVANIAAAENTLGGERRLSDAGLLRHLASRSAASSPL